MYREMILTISLVNNNYLTVTKMIFLCSEFLRFALLAFCKHSINQLNTVLDIPSPELICLIIGSL